MSEDLTKNLPSDATEQILFLLRGLDARMTSLDTRMSGLEELFDRRLMETRPIWELVLVRLEGIETRLGGHDTRLDGLDKAIDNLGLDMRAGFKRLERQMGQLAADVVAVRTDQSDLERRMDRLEDKHETERVG